MSQKQNALADREEATSGSPSRATAATGTTTRLISMENGMSARKVGRGADLDNTSRSPRPGGSHHRQRKRTHRSRGGLRGCGSRCHYVPVSNKDPHLSTCFHRKICVGA
eukprot:3612183-Rhodomonas_salina.3